MTDGLKHILGDRDQEFEFLPQLPKRLTASEKEARRVWDDHEKRALINEKGNAKNKSKLNLEGTHYQQRDVSMELVDMQIGL